VEEKKKKPTMDEIESMMEEGGVELLPDGTVKRPEPPKPKVEALEDVLAREEERESEAHKLNLFQLLDEKMRLAENRRLVAFSDIVLTIADHLEKRHGSSSAVDDLRKIAAHFQESAGEEI